VLGLEVGGNSSFVSMVESVTDESVDKRGLSNKTVAHHNDFEHLYYSELLLL